HVSEKRSVSVRLNSNRPRVQLLDRLVLPNERDPKGLNDALTTMLRGDEYRLAGRWQRLKLNNPIKILKQQQQLMQAQLKRPLNFKDAYIDTPLLNVYGGPGETTVWIDHLEAGPVLEAQPAGQKPLRPG